MTQAQARGTAYTCPMHPDVRGASPGTCPKCGMALVPEDAGFRRLRHLAGNPLILAAMAAVVVAIMWMVFM